MATSPDRTLRPCNAQYRRKVVIWFALSRVTSSCPYPGCRFHPPQAAAHWPVRKWQRQVISIISAARDPLQGPALTSYCHLDTTYESQRSTQHKADSPASGISQPLTLNNTKRSHAALVLEPSQETSTERQRCGGSQQDVSGIEFLANHSGGRTPTTIFTAARREPCDAHGRHNQFGVTENIVDAVNDYTCMAYLMEPQPQPDPEPQETRPASHVTDCHPLLNSIPHFYVPPGKKTKLVGQEQTLEGSGLKGEAPK
jgi:hypothetical protein